MRGFWLTFTDGSQAYCEGADADDAKRIAEKLTSKTVAAKPDGRHREYCAQPLPYPANPVVWQFEHPVHGKCPTFCHSPRECAGRTSCPQRFACSE